MFSYIYGDLSVCLSTENVDSQGMEGKRPQIHDADRARLYDVERGQRSDQNKRGGTNSTLVPPFRIWGRLVMV